ncbi:hypothetical protein, partial [Pedobacter antarcticus]|uniref:hypothetical protein n=1 Tax=Pedobacter antarcticus TaxID=34086 RepID=UPI00292DC606
PAKKKLLPSHHSYAVGKYRFLHTIRVMQKKTAPCIPAILPLDFPGYIHASYLFYFLSFNTLNCQQTTMENT